MYSGASCPVAKIDAATSSIPKATVYYHQPGGHFEINFPAHLIDRILHVTALHWKTKSLEAAGPLSGHGWHFTKQLGGRGRVSPVGLWWC